MTVYLVIGVSGRVHGVFATYDLALRWIGQNPSGFYTIKPWSVTQE